MLLGLVVGLGTTKLLSFAISIVLGYLILRQRHRIQVPFILWLIVVPIAVSALWSVDPGKPLYMACTILIAYLAYRTLPRSRFRIGLYAIVAAQIGVVVWQYWSGEFSRPNGFSRNASVLGLAGMWGLPLLPMAIMGGISGSRTAILGALILGLRSRRAMISSMVLVLVFLCVTLTFYPQRLGLDGLRQSYALRVAAIEGDPIEPNPTSKPVELKEVEWHWYGYGFGQYYLATGHIQPHNIFVRTWFEMGLLSIPVGYALVWLWSEMARGNGWRAHDWLFLLTACATGMLTDELIGSFEGVYMVLGYVIILGARRSRECSDVGSERLSCNSAHELP